MTTTPPQPPQQNPFQPEGGGYAPPPGPPQYQPPVQPGQPQYGQAPQAPYQPQQGQPYQPGQPPQQGQPFPGQPFQEQPFQGQPQQQFPQYGPGDQQGAQYQQPQQAPQYGQQQPGQFPQGQQFGQGLQCRFCGGVPAVDATVRGHQGFVIVMRFLKLQGPFCKTCGVATTRDMTGKSMVQGWWGIGSLIINPITMLMNLVTFSKFRNLPEPAPGAPGRPMNPGKPLFKRPVALGLLIPIAVFGLIVFSNLNKASSADVGSCVYNKGTSAKPNVKVVDCTSSDAKYKVVGKIPGVADSSACARYEESTVSYTDERGSSKYTLCLAPN
ncbi:LppU/SCO3897 family protein [Kribbella sp. CA-294648]|uniref:LppU/SCO3897 family protein n=1 Tax=Kribbella sp. CA-294648 TaxID=3239948 RepID=UPI003D8CB328